MAAGKPRLRLASLIQYTVPGAPTVYYGDEVGMTGDDDPDDRRTYPWVDRGGTPDTALFEPLPVAGRLRKSNAALTSGDFRVLLADDARHVVAYGRKTGSQAAIVVAQPAPRPATITIPVAGYLPNGVSLYRGLRRRQRGTPGAPVGQWRALQVTLAH